MGFLRRSLLFLPGDNPRFLTKALDGPADADAERAWLDEARRRHGELAEGKVEPVPAGRVFENLRSRLKE